MVAGTVRKPRRRPRAPPELRPDRCRSDFASAAVGFGDDGDDDDCVVVAAVAAAVAVVVAG